MLFRTALPQPTAHAYPAWKKSFWATAIFADWRLIKIERIKCPYCGYRMPVWYDPEKADVRGIFVRCKGKWCRREFEIQIQAIKKQSK